MVLARHSGILFVLAFLLLSITGAAEFPAGRCTDLSIRNRPWHISDLTLGPSDFPSSLSFQLQNSATGYTARCSVLGDENTCQLTTALNDARMTFYWWVEADNTIKLHLDQTWNCSDASPNRSITFNAVANATIARNCSASGSQPNVICQTSGSGTVFPSLLSPFRIDFSPPSKPPNGDTPGCLARSLQNSCTISNFYFSASYVGMVTFGSIPSYSGYMGFNVTNTANKFTVACPITDFELGYFLVNATQGDKWIDCRSIPLESSRERPEYKIVTRVRFNEMSRKFSVHQVWFCDTDKSESESPTEATAVMFEGSGTADLPLNCVRSGSPWDYQISMTCTAPEFTVASSNTSRTDLTANALSQARSDLPSCTVSSFNFSSWVLHDFQYMLSSAVYMNQPPDYKASYWGFEVYVNQSTESINYSCSGWRVLNPTDENSCYPWPWRMKPEEDYIKRINVTYRYDIDTYRITINTVWLCSDLDSSHPITFNATGSAILPTSCTNHPECAGKGTDDCGLVQCQKLGQAVIPVESLLYRQ